MHLTPFLLLIASTGTLAKHPSYPRLAPKVQRIARQLPESGLFARQDCPGQSCGTGCIDLGDSCCDVMVGNYCTAGETCNYDGTCCPVGETCGFDDTISDDISIDDDITVDNCGIDESMCGSGCIPFNAECCDNDEGWYCDPGYDCASGQTCDVGDPDIDILDDDDDDGDDEDAGSSISPSLLLVAMGAYFALF